MNKIFLYIVIIFLIYAVYIQYKKKSISNIVSDHENDVKTMYKNRGGINNANVNYEGSKLINILKR